MGHHRTQTGILILAGLFAAIADAQPKTELQYAIVLTRHGVRSPTWEPDRLNKYSAQPWPSFGVPPGNLTTHGRTLMEIMGAYYREMFSANGLLGKPNCADARKTYYWADTDQRTLETAKALAQTMLPGCAAEIHSVADGKPDPLFDPLDAGVVHLNDKTAMAAVMGSLGSRPEAILDAYKPAFDTLTNILNGTGKAKASIFDDKLVVTAGKSGLSMTGPLSFASTLTEDFLLEYTNGMKGNDLGWGRLTQPQLLQIMSLHTAYADLMRRTPYLAKARGSLLLNRILNSLEQAATGKPVKGAIGPVDSKLVVISGHDTNLSNLSGALGLSWVIPSHQPDDAPPGGALIFSLWKETGTNRYSLRLQLVSQTLDQMHDATKLTLSSPPATAEVFIPGCADTTCQWADFQKAAKAAIDPAFVP